MLRNVLQKLNDASPWGYRPPKLPMPIQEFRLQDWPHETKKTLDRIQVLFMLATKASDGPTAYAMAFEHMDRGRWDEAALWLFLAAERGDTFAMADLGAMYLLGIGLEEDEEASKHWISKSGGAISAFLQQNAREVVKEAAGKKRIKAQIIRNHTNPKDPATFSFFGRPEGGSLSVPIHPNDIAEECVWGPRHWVNTENAPESGFYTQNAMSEAYFNIEEYSALSSKWSSKKTVK